MRKNHRKVRIIFGGPEAPASKTPELGPAWLRAAEALDKIKAEIPDEPVAASLIAKTLSNGSGYVFVSSLSWESQVPGSSIYIDDKDLEDEWDEFTSNKYAKELAARIGLVNLDLIGPTNDSFAVTPQFWEASRDIMDDLRHWEWNYDGFFVTLKDEIANKYNKSKIHFKEPIFYAAHIDIILRLYQLSMANTPTAIKQSPGRPRSSKWDQWTAFLVGHIHEFGIEEHVDPRSIASRIDAKLASCGHDKVDARDARRTIEVVQKHLKTIIGKPPKT